MAAGAPRSLITCRYGTQNVSAPVAARVDAIGRLPKFGPFLRIFCPEFPPNFQTVQKVASGLVRQSRQRARPSNSFFQNLGAPNGPAAHAPCEISPLQLLSFLARSGLRVGIHRLAGGERVLKARTLGAVRAIKARAIPRGISTHILGSPRGKSTRKLRVPGGKLRAVLVATLWRFPAFRNSGGPY